MKRIEYLDTSRGFAIFLVVIAHCLGWNMPDWREVMIYDYNQPTNYKVAAFIWQVIYSFHMPLFFLISGYLNYKEVCKSIDLCVASKHKTCSLLLPYITSGFIMLFLKGYYGYWFFFSLWELSLLAVFFNYILPKINRSNQIWIDVIILVFVYIILRIISKYVPTENPICEPVKFVGYYIPFFFGYLIRKYNCIEYLMNGKFTLYLVIASILFFTRYFGTWSENIIMRGLHFIEQFVLPITASLLIISFFKNCNNRSWISQKLNLVGQNTIDIYIFHLLFVIQIPAIGLFWLSTNISTCITTQIVYATLVSVIAIILSLILGSFLKKSRILKFILFGKR